jgi:hypothetical protein
MILIIPIFFVLGSLVVLSYMIGVYLMKTFPDNYDVNGIWAGLQYQNKIFLYLWYLGEILSCGGFLCLTCFLWEDAPGQEVFVVFYTLFLVSACFWMPLAIQGDRFYSLTIFFLFLTSLSTIGLLVESFRFWGPKSHKPWLLIPLTLHCTFFDMIYWCWTWSPSDLNKVTGGGNNNTKFSRSLESRSLFVVAEEEDDEQQSNPGKISISDFSLKYDFC